MRATALAYVLLAASVASAPVLAQGTPDSCDNCGKVVKVTMATSEATAWRPLGTVAAGSVGDDLAQPGRTTTTFQFTPGEKKPQMVALGAAGGVAYTKQSRDYQRPRWDIAIRMDGGEMRTISTDYDPLVQDGDRVRVFGTQLERIAPQ